MIEFAAESTFARSRRDSGKVFDRGHYEKWRAVLVGHSIAAVLAVGACLSMGGWVQALESPQGEEKEKPAVLYFFFTPECRDAPEAARRAKAFLWKNSGKIRLRPVLLIRDFKRLARTEEGDPFQLAMKELGELGPLDIPLYDEEGLKLAGHWKVDVVPAFVLVARGRAHRVLGGRVDLEEVFRCEK